MTTGSMMESREDDELMELSRKHAQRIDMIVSSIYSGNLQTKKEVIQELLLLEKDILKFQIEYINVHGNGLLNREFISNIENKSVSLEQIDDKINFVKHLK